MKKLNKIVIITLAILISVSFTFESIRAEETDVSNDDILKDQNLYKEEIDDINDMSKYEKYIIQNSFGDKYANSELMAQDNLNEDEKLLVKEIALSYNNFARESDYTPKAFPMYHGRYCGKGNLGGKPKDRLDVAYKKHDNCYAKYGWGKCKCDYPFVVSALSIAKNKKYSIKYRAKAKGAAYVFGVKATSCIAVKKLYKKS
ncbi:hypothetical protein JTF04_03620 [Mammaliicoccus vitulinus]|uniref:hypothetical protein n=1 Tax=Mammaliicoccus vitulinus TaxID=71237 RepID=UPI001950187E|nr:hypothetical protein [Mammaliicoccus vitulinus]MBM6628760.1 hypothetical protein [Mammaliicoccus vitulinus]MBO3076763.1 hypothetical protein [Mammaliicoccus vitulinus]